MNYFDDLYTELYYTKGQKILPIRTGVRRAEKVSFRMDKEPLFK